MLARVLFGSLAQSQNKHLSKFLSNVLPAAYSPGVLSLRCGPSELLLFKLGQGGLELLELGPFAGPISSGWPSKSPKSRAILMWGAGGFWTCAEVEGEATHPVTRQRFKFGSLKLRVAWFIL